MNIIICSIIENWWNFIPKLLKTTVILFIWKYIWDSIFYFSCEYIYSGIPSLWNLTTTTKYRPMCLISTATHNQFGYILFHITSLHSINRSEKNRFQQVMDENFHNNLNKKYNHQHNLSYFWNAIFDNYIINFDHSVCFFYDSFGDMEWIIKPSININHMSL